MRESPVLSMTAASGPTAEWPATPTAPAPKRLTLARDPMRVALFILTIVTVSRVHQHYPVLAKLRPALLLTLAAAGYAWAHPKYLTRANVFNLWPMRRVALLGMLACASAVFGISLGASGKFILETYGKTLLYAFLLVVSIRNVRDLYTYVWAYVIACGILSYFATFVFKIVKSDGTAVTRLSDLYTYDANDLGLVLIVGLAFALLLLHVARGYQRISLLVILGAMVVSIARSGSRGAFLGLIAVGIAGLILINSVSAVRRITLVVAAAIALLLAAPPGYWEQMHTIAAPSADYNLTSTDGRKQVAMRGLGYAAAYPLFGIGIGNFGKAECTISAEKAEAGGHLRCGAPHNSYVQTLAELGFFGGLVWASLIVTGIRSMLKLRGRLPRAWRRGTDAERFMYASTHFNVIALIGFAVTAFFLSFAWMDIYYILAVFISGYSIALKGMLSEQGPTGGELVGSHARDRTRRRGWRVVQSAARYPALSAFGPGPSPTRK
jgi:O-antigen ligase